MPPKQSMWADTSVYVTKSFRLNKVLSHRIPSQITFTEDDKMIYFLAGSGRSCLYSVNFEQGIYTMYNVGGVYFLDITLTHLN